MEEFPKFRTDTREPIEAPPPLSCDCQFHVFGDPERYRVRGQSAYPSPTDATVGAALKIHRALGIDRGVIVQATAYGTNHDILFDALAAAGPTYRGVALVDDGVDDAELRRLHEAGVRGARFNFWKQLNIAPTPDEFRRAIARIADHGWHAKIHAAGDEWLEIADLLAEVRIPVVIDHMGHPDLSRGLDQPALRVLLDLLRNDNWWVMISNGDRASAEARGWDDALPVTRMLLDAAPDRAIWCTDWPHVQYRKPVMPNDAELLEFLYRVVPDATERRKVLVDNPARLFGF